MKPLRVLCFGAGYFSQFHLDAWRRIPEVQLVGLCDLDLEKAKSVAAQSGIPRTYSDPAFALRDAKPDFVDVITRPDSHLSLIELAAAQRLPIICQKPLAPDFATAVKLVETARAASVPLMVHENFRFQPWHREIKRLLVNRTIGDRLHSLTCRSRMGDGFGDDAYLSRQPYFRQMPRLLVHETGVHFIDLFRFLAGEINEVYAVLRRLNPVISGEDSGLLMFRFDSGAVGVWDANRYNEGTAADPRLTLGEFLIEGSGGSIRLFGDARMTIQPLGGTEVEHSYPWARTGFSGDCVYQTQRHFVEQLLAGASFETSGSEYLKTLTVQEAAYQSAATNSPVSVVGQDVSVERPLPFSSHER